MQFEVLIQALTGFGLPGIIAALVILIGVYVARKAGLVATGDQARLANIVLSAILFGLSANPQAEGALMAAISSMLAGLAHEGIQWLTDYMKNQKVNAQ